MNWLGSVTAKIRSSKPSIADKETQTELPDTKMDGEKESWKWWGAKMAGKTAIGVGAAAGASVAAPTILSWAGFGTAGVTAGSLATWLQPWMQGGAIFGTLQSAGAAGMGICTKSAVAAAGWYGGWKTPSLLMRKSAENTGTGDWKQTENTDTGIFDNDDELKESIIFKSRL